MTTGFQGELFHQSTPQQGVVECLGMTFESQEARREYFVEKLREKLKDPEFRKIEGFPIGEDEDILALSDPPYYTACPNPFIEEFIKYWNQLKESDRTSNQDTLPDASDYHREPFAADVSEGKNDPIYLAHSYHTKVPHKAIMRYILHYTEPGDIVFDGFCGTGMTGVAAQICGERVTVESLGYKVQKDGTILDEEGKPFSKLGVRRAILNDLSPAATFIAYNYNTPVNITEFEREAKRILAEVEKEYGWMYLTLHQPNQEQIEKAIALLELADLHLKTKGSELPWGSINYTVWSDVFTCPECSNEVVYWKAAIDKEAGKVLDGFPCPHCNAQLNKRIMDRAWVTRFDTAINQTIRQAKQVPVLINYSVGKKRFEKTPDAFELALIDKIENSVIPYWFPIDRMPEGFNTEQPKVSHGITHVHHFYTKRNLSVFAAMWNRAKTLVIKCALMGGYRVGLKMSTFLVPQYFNKSTGPMKPLTAGTLYVPSLSGEQNWLNILESRSDSVARQMKAMIKNQLFKNTAIATLSSTAQDFIRENSVDYLFTDPPFGGNLMYSELNFINESFIKNYTKIDAEAIENKVQGKGLLEYQELMTQCFEEYYRVLKPGRWMTVEFHNSKNSVWNSIQEALQRARFVIADVRTLDKKQGSFKQVNSSSAVKQDLIISSYKPSTILEERFKLEAGTEEGVWAFVRTHLQQLPVFVSKNGQAEAIAERQNYLLFDRMVAFHIQRGVTVPLSASEFYAGLSQRFSERDGMYFLPEQVAEYDKKRMTVSEILQLELFVTDESSAVQWLKQQLTKKPQTFQELHPNFMREIAGWSKFEKPLELSELLEQNFLRYDGKGSIPNQIVSWLKQSATHREKIRQLEGEAPTDAAGLETRDAGLLSAAKDRWYVPDPNKASDLEKLRDRALLREFEEYRQSKQKKLKVFRLEAVRTGFKKAWQERDYRTIIDVASKIPETVLQEDPKLLMFYDQAVTRSSEE